MDDAVYFDLVAETAYRVTGRRPLSLRNPFTGRVFWVEGMHNCPREMFEQAAAETGTTSKKDLMGALLN